MSNLPFLHFQPNNLSGAILAGCKLYTYAAGTTTPKATYPTRANMLAGTSANTNPIIADANGLFGEIFALEDAAYKFVLKDSSDVTIWTKDNIDALTATSSSFQTRIKQVASNPLDYGAIGDGVANEASQVQQAVDNATGVVDLLGKTFRCDTTITLRSGLTLQNGTLNFSSSASDEYVKLLGTRSSAVALSANVAAGDETMTLASVSGLAAGDWLFVRDSANYGGGSDDHGEVVRIESIAGSVVTLNEPLIDAYTTANSATAQKLNVKQNVVLRDLVVACSSAASGAGRAIHCEIVDGLFIQNVRVTNPKGSGVEVRAGINVGLFGCTVVGDTGSDDAGIGYNIAAHSRNVGLLQCRVIQMFVGLKIGAADVNQGVTRFVSTDEFGAYGCGTGISVIVTSDLTTLRGEVVKPSGGTVLSDSGFRTRNLGVADIVAGNFDGITGVGGGTGAGLKGTGGATGKGVHGIGGSTSGPGVYGIATAGNSNGVEGAGQGSGAGVYGSTTSSGHALSGVASGSGHGVSGVSSGTGYGVYSESDATSPDKASLFIAPQDTDPTTVAAGGIYVNSTSKLPSAADGVQWNPMLVKFSEIVANVQRTSSGTYATATIPAGRLRVGSRIRVSAIVRVTAYTSGTAAIDLSWFGSNIATTDAGYTPAASHVIMLELFGTIRTVHASTGTLAHWGQSTYGLDNGSTNPVSRLSAGEPSSKDTTAAVAITANITQSGTMTSILTDFVVEISD